VKKWFTKNDAETIFERLEQHGKTWKIYVMEPMSLSFHGIIHYSRLRDRLATNVVPFAEFERDAAAGETVRRTVCEAEVTYGGQPGNRSPKWIFSAARGAVQVRLRCHLASARMIAR
jgi:hypothetical protein